MSNDCPPSSPTSYPSRSTLASRAINHATMGKKGDLFSERSSARQVPTPQPSSSIGVPYSSPVKEQYQIPTSPSRGSIHERTALPPKALLNVELDLSNFTTLSIGRKRTLCDVVLPGLPNISRRHVVITNLKEERRIAIECTGINGLVVELPQDQTISHLGKTHGQENSFEVSLLEESVPQGTGNINKITQFSLDKGEKVTLPFAEGLKIDFRQATITFNEKKLEWLSESSSALSDVDEGSSSSISDIYSKQATPEYPANSHPRGSNGGSNSDQAPMAGRTSTDMSQVVPSNVMTQAAVTPYTQTVVMDPKTPKKMNMKGPGKRDYETPVPDKNIANKHTTHHLDHTTSSGKSALNFSNTQDISIELPSKRQKIQTGQSPAVHNEDAHANITDHAPMKKGKSRKVFSGIDTEHFHMITAADLEAKGINCHEIQHILSNHLAFAAQQQTPLSQLKTISTSVAQLTEAELRFLLENEKSIGVIKREGKDAAGKLLEEEFYYDIENDYDENRRGLVTSLKGGRAGIRSSRKSHKQYFWKRPSKK